MPSPPRNENTAVSTHLHSFRSQRNSQHQHKRSSLIEISLPKRLESVERHTKTILMKENERQKLLPRSEGRTDFAASDKSFRVMYYVLACLQAISVPVFLAGQTVSIFAYDWTVRMGLQESGAEIGESFVQVNRAYGVSDTILYIPLLTTSAYGLFRKQRWALICTAASAGIHSYWAFTHCFIFLFLSNSTAYTYQPDAGTWAFLIFFVSYGIVILFFLYGYWDKLLDVLE